MITNADEVRITENSYDSRVILYGLSDDSKPSGLVNGSEFVEIDTLITYLYDAENDKWYPEDEGD